MTSQQESQGKIVEGIMVDSEYNVTCLFCKTLSPVFDEEPIPYDVKKVLEHVEGKQHKVCVKYLTDVGVRFDICGLHCKTCSVHLEPDESAVHHSYIHHEERIIHTGRTT